MVRGSEAGAVALAASPAAPAGHFAAPAAAELELVRRFALEGDRRAFEELVRLRLPSIRRFLALRLSDPEEAREAEQEVLLRLFRSLSRFRGESSLSTWIYRICAAASADLVRARARERRRAERLGLASVEADPPGAERPWAEGPELGLERKEAAAALRRALAALGEPNASLVYLRDAEGLSIGELARCFGLPEGTVKSRLARSRARLRVAMEAQDGSAGAARDGASGWLGQGAARRRTP